MATKVSGKELKLFFSDKQCWNDRFIDDHDYEDEENVCLDLDRIVDGKTYVIDATWGNVYKENPEEYLDFVCSTEQHFKKWRKAQTVQYALIEYPKDMPTTELRRLLKSVGLKLA